MASYFNRVYCICVGLILAGLLPAATLLAVESKTISSVDVQQDEGGVTRIVLRGASDPIYTAFLRENPHRLIVEMPDVVFNGVATPLRVENGVVNSVMLGAFGDPRVALSMARVSVGLEGESDYELTPIGDELVIEIRPKFEVMAKASEPAPAPVPAAAAEPDDVPMPDFVAAVPTEVEPEAVVSVATVEQPSEPDSMSAPVAEPDSDSMSEPAMSDEPGVSRILRVTANGDMIEIEADGPIDNLDSFALEAPQRLVVDFWGAENGVSSNQFSIASSSVERVRIGEHPDKVRVVFDLALTLESHVVEPTATGVQVRLVGSQMAAAEMAEETVPAAAEEPMAEEPVAEDWAAEEEPAEEPQADSIDESVSQAEEAAVAPEDEPAVELEEFEPEEVPAEFEPVAGDDSAAPADVTIAYADAAEVESVHFESLPAVDRVVVTMSDPLEAKVVEADPSTLIVMLPGATLQEGAERRVETTDFSGPVTMFSVFTTPDIEGDEVRVVMKRRPGASAELHWREGQLHIELARAGGAASGPAVLGAMPVPESMGPDGAEMPVQDPSMLDTGTPETSGLPVAEAEVPASLAPEGATPNSLGFDADFFGGPADPASIDILEEGGFADDKVYGGRRVSLDFKDADIANILRLIAEVSDLNVIAGEEVVGRVTIRLVDVPWDQALDVILLTKGLGFVRVGNVLRIAPLETIKLEAEQRLQERRAKEKLEDLVVKLQPVNFADVKEIQQLVKRLLSGRGSANVDRRTNTLIIKDIPSVVHEATALVKAIDTQTPQVMIEAKIVEASLGFSRSLGAVWGAGYRPGSNTGGGKDFHLADGTLPATNGGGLQATNFLASNPVLGAINGLLNLGVLAMDDQLQLDLQIQAAEATNKGKVISSPRVVTLDNREAVIKQGVAIKFESATRDRITISFVDAVLELKVTPHITANRSIIMEIKISRNAPELSEASGDIVGISKNETETEALVKDGETIVLGGIYVVETGGGHSKTPFLSDIPILGAAFRNMTHSDERRELLVFVTPRVIMGSPSQDL
ncbi:MAG: type IV pilus secretin PilQ [Deltaproteobacteria bacterium]|nr:type IV pilus secretin PilQ [Deltaproteobacteria bacterium]